MFPAPARADPDPGATEHVTIPKRRPTTTTTTEAAAEPMSSRDARSVLEHALFEVKRIVVGQDRMIERLFVCLLARGHCLLEGAPGLAKTLAAETVATVSGGDFSRIQFTPDLVPADRSEEHTSELQ